MPNINDLTQSRFMSKADAGKGILLTIRAYKQEDVAMEGEPEKLRWILEFNEHEKGLVLNPTNGQLLAQITGSPDFDNWIGHKIVLFNDPTISFGGKLVGGIRVRPPRNQPAAPPAKPAPVVEAAEPGGDDVPF